MDLKCTIGTFYCGGSIPCQGTLRWTPGPVQTIYLPQPTSPAATPLAYSGQQWSFQLFHGPAGKWTTYVKGGDGSDPTGAYIRSVGACPDAPASVTVAPDD